MKPLRLRRSAPNGYLLLEVIIAVTIFSLAFVGLMRVLRQSQDAASQFAFETHIHSGLEAILAQVCSRPVDEMTLEETDSLLGVVYQTEVEPLALSSQEGSSLQNLYRLRARATYDRGRGPEEDVAEIWVYHAEQTTK